METHKRTDEITDKKEYTGESKKAPKGDFYMGPDKFACWKDEQFDAFEVGDVVTVEYTETKNVTPDKTYINRSITGIVLLSEETGVEPTELDEEVVKVEETAEKDKVSVTRIMEVEFSDAEMKIIKFAKTEGVTVSQGTLAIIGDLFLSNIKL